MEYKDEGLLACYLPPAFLEPEKEISAGVKMKCRVHLVRISTPAACIPFSLSATRTARLAALQYHKVSQVAYPPQQKCNSVLYSPITWRTAENTNVIPTLCFLLKL